MRRLLAPLAAAALCPLVLAACGGARASVPTTLAPRTLPASTTSLPAATTTTTAPGTGPVPAVITVQYVDAVFAQLNHVYGNATRSIVAAHKLTRDAVDDLRSMFTDNTLAVQLQLAEETVRGDLSNFRMPPGDRITTVTEMLTSRPSCIYVRSGTDYSPVLLNSVNASGVEYIELTPKVSIDDVHGLNESPWMIAFVQSFQTVPTSPPPDPCDA